MQRNPAAKMDWRTPTDVRDPIVAHWGCVSLDPCTTRDNPIGAEHIRTAECDPNGLQTNWNAFAGLWYVNPPYTNLWYVKLAAELIRRQPSSECIALLMAKPGAAYFQTIAKSCDAVCFVRGRLRFVGAPDAAPFESALLYAGDRAKRFARAFSNLGWVVSI